MHITLNFFIYCERNNRCGIFAINFCFKKLYEAMQVILLQNTITKFIFIDTIWQRI